MLELPLELQSLRMQKAFYDNIQCLQDFNFNAELRTVFSSSFSSAFSARSLVFTILGCCMLGVFLLLAFTLLGCKCQDIWSLCNAMHVNTEESKGEEAELGSIPSSQQQAQ